MSIKNLSLLTVLTAFLFRLGAMVSTGWGMSDDALITLRVARNLALGFGPVYNIGDYSQASSSPLWMLISAAIWQLTGDLSRLILPILGSVADSLTAGTIVLLTYQATKLKITSLGAGLIYACLSTSVLIAPLGLETGFYTLITALAFLMLGLNKTVWAAVLGGLAILLRPDGVLLALIVLLVLLKRKQLVYPLAMVLLITIPWFLFAYFYYGTVVPQTVTAKSMVIHTPSEQWRWFVDKFFIGGPKAYVGGALILIGNVVALKYKTLVPLVVWAMLYVFVFSTFGSWWPWYLPPVMIAFTIGVALSISLVRKIGIVVIMIMCVCLALAYGTISLINKTISASVVYQHRREMAAWLNSSTPETATIMLEPLGILGYFTNRTFWDYPGLASRKVTDSLPHKIPGKPIDLKTMESIVYKLKPDFIILREDELQGVGVLEGYREVKVFPVPSEITVKQPAFQTMYVLANIQQYDRRSQLRPGAGPISGRNYFNSRP